VFKPGWNAIIQGYNESQVVDKERIESVKEQLLDEIKSSLIYGEVFIRSSKDPFRGAPLDHDGNPIHEHFFSSFQGILMVPETGHYSFYLTSDDGAQFFVDDILVC
jgi:hypothetical protein